MFTSLRLGVMWRTEQLIYYYIKMTWASAVCYCQATWFRVGDRVHLERDCIIKLPSEAMPSLKSFRSRYEQCAAGLVLEFELWRLISFIGKHF